MLGALPVNPRLMGCQLRLKMLPQFLLATKGKPQILALHESGWDVLGTAETHGVQAASFDLLLSQGQAEP